MQDFYIGVDGGGTKTRAIIQDEIGNLLGSGESGPANVTSSVMGSWQSVRQAINLALNQIKIDNLKNARLHVGLGLAGSTEVPSARSAFLNVPHPYHTLVLNNDAYTACLGAHGGGNGGIIILGTGSIGFQIENEIVSRAGGYGFPHSDEGGGAWLGMECVRALFHAVDGIQPWTPLLKKIFSSNQDDLAQFTAFSSEAKPSDFAELARPLVEALKDPDPLALRLIREAALHVDRLWDALQMKSTTSLPFCLLGGLAPFIRPYISNRLRATLVSSQFDATIGAIMMLKKQMHAE